MHGKIRGILLLVCPTTSTVRHRNADNQDNLSKTIVLKICHHLRSGEFDAAIRFLLHASRLETKSGMAVKLPFAVLLAWKFHEPERSRNFQALEPLRKRLGIKWDLKSRQNRVNSLFLDLRPTTSSSLRLSGDFCGLGSRWDRRRLGEAASLLRSRSE